MSQPDAGSGPGLPPGVDEPVFSEPWQAEAFAMVVALHRRGLFTWSEWAAALSEQVHRDEAAADGHDYYQHWLAALERILVDKGVAGLDEIDALTVAWQRAALATPHGKQILLENDRSGIPRR